MWHEGPALRAVFGLLVVHTVVALELGAGCRGVATGSTLRLVRELAKIVGRRRLGGQAASRFHRPVAASAQRQA